jgi:predicted dehydrogenase
MPVALETAPATPPAAGPRLGFAGLGWIGAQRLQALAESGIAHAAALCEPDPARVATACAKLAPAPVVCPSFEELLEEPLDGIVIATPNAMHEAQVRAALERGIAVFCQKPLATSRAGTERLVALARRRGLPLGVDWSYRHLAGMTELRRRIREGAIGEIVAAELCFHNAYGPGAAWYYDVAQAGGGCLLDLGCHLIDLCDWLLGLRAPVEVQARCYRAGTRLVPPYRECEDSVLAGLDFASGAHVQLACSWRAPVGRGAVIACRAFGTGGGAEIVNLDGSFYAFEVALTRGAEREVLGAPPDAWPGRALVAWARELSDTDGDDLDRIAATADVIDRVYGRATGDAD